MNRAVTPEVAAHFVLQRSNPRYAERTPGTPLHVEIWRSGPTHCSNFLIQDLPLPLHSPIWIRCLSHVGFCLRAVAHAAPTTPKCSSLASDSLIPIQLMTHVLQEAFPDPSPLHTLLDPQASPSYGTTPLPWHLFL